jgi:aspartate-semialdehyde dehydrogenase
LAENRVYPINGVADRPLVAVVGGDSLLARELRELIGESKPAPRMQLISASTDGTALLAAEDEEAVVMVPLSPESLVGASVAFLAGSHASSRRALKINPAGGPRLIDLTGALEEQPDARLRAPLAEVPGDRPATDSSIQVIAHPAAIALAALLSRIGQEFTIRRTVAHVFEPASEHGQRGLDELQQQTVAVLSFQKLKTDVFDTQLAFNLLAQYGEEAMEPLELIEQRLERHLASLLAAFPGFPMRIPMPSLRVLQAPVFHGHSFSVWIEFEEIPAVEALSSSLSSGGIDVRPDEPPSNAGIAGQSGLSVGGIRPDRNQPRAMWIWMVADNLRLTAENAIAVAKEMML